MYRIKNIKTGLYYQPSKSGCNLSKTGKVYHHKTNLLTMSPNIGCIRINVRVRNRVFGIIKEHYNDTKYWSRYRDVKDLESLGEYEGISLYIPKEDFKIEEL